MDGIIEVLSLLSQVREAYDSKKIMQSFSILDVIKICYAHDSKLCVCLSMGDSIENIWTTAQEGCELINKLMYVWVNEWFNSQLNDIPCPYESFLVPFPPLS